MASLSMYEAALQPAPADRFDRVFKGMLAAGAAMGRMDKQDDKALQYLSVLYRKSLEDLPLDLLEKAVRLTVEAWRFPGIPEAAGIREHVNGELGRRRIEAARVRAAVKMLETKTDRGDLTDEEKKAFWDRIAEMKAAPSAEPEAIPNAAPGASLSKPGRLSVADIAKVMKAGFHRTDPVELFEGMSADRVATYWGFRLKGATPEQAKAIASGEASADDFSFQAEEPQE